MKYLVLLLLTVLIGTWRLRRGRRAPQAAAHKAAPASVPLTRDMLACAHCGLHIPRAEAWMRGDRAFCCAQHQGRPDQV